VWSCAILAVPVLVAGVGLYVLPGPGSRHWAWTLPPIAAQAIAAWLIGLALLLGTMARETGLRRIRPAAVGLAVLAALLLLALARYPHAAHGAAAIAWIVLLAAIGILGGYGLARLAAIPREPAIAASRPQGAR
jgi:hypothetical protein